MDAQNALARKCAFLRADITKRIERRAAAAHAQPVRVRQNGIVRPRRQEVFRPANGNLLAIRIRLRLIGRGEYDIIPDREISPVQRAAVVLPRVEIRLTQEQRIRIAHGDSFCIAAALGAGLRPCKLLYNAALQKSRGILANVG